MTDQNKLWWMERYESMWGFHRYSPHNLETMKGIIAEAERRMVERCKEVLEENDEQFCCHEALLIMLGRLSELTKE